MVDLSVLGLLVALRHLSLRGVPVQDVRTATRLMHFSGLLTLGLNVAEPIAAGHHGRAALDSVAPLLLLGWGAVGPQLLRAFYTARPMEAMGSVEAEAPAAVAEPAPADITPAPLVHSPAPTPPATSQEPAPIPPAPASSPQVPEPLLHEARSIAAAHHREHGEPITVAQLKRRLGVGLPMATALHAALAA
jgi:hypothetical protein